MIRYRFNKLGNVVPQRTWPFWAVAGEMVLLSGCGGTGGVVSTPPLTPAAFTGQMRSGTNPVSGAGVFLYAAGATGPGAGATNLLPSATVTTDASGNFSVPVFQCSSSTAQVYLVGRDGVPSPSSLEHNSALVMMTALGDCGSITASTSVAMNEVTTAASAWALAQFIGPGAEVGASATNATGLRNAFLTAANLANDTTGTAPGETLPADTVLETAKLNTLANILYTCDQSPSGAQCQPLFNATAEGGSAPTNTLDAALSIVRNPSADVAAIFALATQSPFQPALAAAPHDWTLSATFGNCTSGCGGLNLPGSLAIDSQGNVWVANYFGGAASEFSNGGVPASPNGFAATGLDESFGIAVDAQNSVWITNETGNTAGSVTHLSSAGADLSTSGYTGGGIYFPIAIAATASGDIWVADYGSAAATLLANDGSAISGASGDAPAMLPFTTAVAVDANQNGWFAFEGGVAKVTPSNQVTAFACCDVPAGIAVDQSGNIWVADYDASALVEISAGGAVLGEAAATGGVKTPVGIAVDGSGNIWTANYRANTISEFSGATLQPVSPAAGYGKDASLFGPFGVGIDASGNLWISNAYGNTLTELIGAAAPVKTPLLGPPAQP